jgi:hypothetical protein
MNDAKKQLCFVIGPIGAADTETRIHADWLLEEIIRPVMTDWRQFEVKRPDQDPRPGLIDAQLIDDLINADLVIADLSFLNPNAFYEIGIRHVVEKPIIHMQLATEEIPFDLSLCRALKFSLTKVSDLENARNDLKRAVEAVLDPNYQVENPVTKTRGRILLKEHATPEIRVLMDEMRAIQDRLDQIESAMRAEKFETSQSANALVADLVLRGFKPTVSLASARGILGPLFNEEAAKKAQPKKDITERSE